MFDETIITDSPVGQRLEMMSNKDAVSYLMFNNKRIDLVAKITIGRSSDNDVVVDNKLASRHHAVIQKIKMLTLSRMMEVQTELLLMVQLSQRINM